MSENKTIGVNYPTNQGKLSNKTNTCCSYELVPMQVGTGYSSPYTALIGYGPENNKQYLCGGALISEYFILTAAHCLNSRFGPAQYVRLGDLDYAREDDDAQPKEYVVIRRIPHPQYRPPEKYHDIALLQVDKKIETAIYIGIGCLDVTREHTGENVTVTGWGQIEFSGSVSTHLLRGDLQVVGVENCAPSYSSDTQALPNGIQDDLMICAAGVSDTCNGDSGGPLVQRRYFGTSNDVFNIVGITSFGKACGISGDPGVYTRVQAYLGWIEENVWPNE